MKKVQFKCIKEAGKSFELIKEKLPTKYIISLPNFDQNFELQFKKYYLRKTIMLPSIEKD